MAFIPSKNRENDNNNLELKKEEIEFLIAKLSETDFKGREVEILYNIVLKLQERYKRF